MRVISGEVKGLRLKSPRSSPIRPTTGLIRGAIFSMLQPVAGARVLDLYAGTGSLGIEALSRGAIWADFVEYNPRCCAAIRENLKWTGFVPLSHVYCWDVAKALSRLNHGYDIIFLDPPYSDPSIGNILDKLVSSQLVKAGSTIVAQHPSRRPLPSNIKQFHLIKDRRHGDSCISIYRQEEAPWL